MKILLADKNTTIAEKEADMVKAISEKDTAIEAADQAISEKEVAEKKVEEVLKPKDGYAWVIKKTE